MFYYNTLFRFVASSLIAIGINMNVSAQTEVEHHNYTNSNENFTKKTEHKIHTESDLEHLSHDSEEHHHRYELEISYSNSGYYEFTGSIYFAHLMKFQGTIEFTGKHYATVVVKEIPIGHSKWGTFVGVGGTFGFHDHEVPVDGEHYMEVALDEVPHPDDYSTSTSDMETHREWGGSVIIQTGLAYSVTSHWSTGFTLSPGVDVQTGEPTFGATLDVVFGF